MSQMSPIEKTFKENVRQSKALAPNGDHLKFGGATLPATNEGQVQYKQRVSTVINDHVQVSQISQTRWNIHKLHRPQPVPTPSKPP